MRISDWSSDVCSSDLAEEDRQQIEEQRAVVARVERHQATAVELVDGAVQRAQVARLSRERRSVIDELQRQLSLGEVHQGTEANLPRSEERRVGTECVIPVRSRWAPCHKKKKKD